MNALISDFDGTFYDDNYSENINFINNLNIDFIIATGRHYFSLKDDLKIYCKYYICNDGAYILDSNQNFIYKNSIKEEDAKIIYKRIQELKINDFFLDSYDKLTTDLIYPINKFSIKIKNKKTAKNILSKLIYNLDNVYGYLSENYINILNINSTKDIAIDFLVKKEKYNKVYVVGNEINDYNMINKYNGYLITKNKKRDFNCISQFLELKNIIKNS